MKSQEFLTKNHLQLWKLQSDSQFGHHDVIWYRLSESPERVQEYLLVELCLVYLWNSDIDPKWF